MDPARMIPGIGGAMIGGLLGAIIWAAFMYFAHMEAAFIAWGIGGLVGFGSLVLGGRGSVMGVVCGLIAALSIFGGKAVGYRFLDGQSPMAIEEMEEDRELYEEFMEDARLFGSVSGDDAIKAFMVERDYTMASNPSRISDDELYDFLEEMEYYLRSWGESPPTYEEWYAEWYEIEPEDEGYPGEESPSAISNLLGSIGLFDIIFFFLGVTTAFQVVASRQEMA